MICGGDHTNVKVKQWFPLGRDNTIISIFLYFNKSVCIQYDEAIYMVTLVIKTQNLGKNYKTYLVQIHTQPLLYPWQTLSYLLSPHWEEPYFSAHLSRTYEDEMTAMDALYGLSTYMHIWLCTRQKGQERHMRIPERKTKTVSNTFDNFVLGFPWWTK